MTSGIAIILYLFVATYLAFRLLAKREAVSGVPKLPKAVWLTLGIVATFVHAAAIHADLFTPAGMNLSFFNALSLVCLLVACLVLVAAIRAPVENLAIALLPMAALTLLLQKSVEQQHLISTTNAAELEFHILTSFLAYSLLTIAALQSMLLYIQDRHLRNKQPGGFIRALPPLETMENLLFQMLAVGFLLQTLSMTTGIFYLEDLFAQHIVHKTVFSIMAWLVFATLLWGHWRHGWRGRKAIRWTLTGFTLLLVAYFGSKWVLEMVLHR